MCRREWSEYYQTYSVFDEQERTSMSCSDKGVSVGTDRGAVLIPHDTFAQLAAEMLEHSKAKGFIS